MTFKFNIGTTSGKTYKLEAEAKNLVGASLGDTIPGEEVSADLVGYELEITGTSDKSGFTSMENVEGVGKKRVLLTYGKGMHKRPKREGKFKIPNPKPKGLRLRKTVIGKVISEDIRQINLKVAKEGAKKLEDIFAAPAAETEAQ